MKLLVPLSLCLLAIAGFSVLRDSASAGVDPVFISMPVKDLVLKVDPVSGAILSQTKVGRLPHHMVVDRATHKLYVVLSGSQAVAEIDTDSGELLRTMLTEPVPELRDDGSRIEAHADLSGPAESVCSNCHNGRADGVNPSIVGSRPFGASLSEDGRTLFVTNTRSRSISEIDLSSGQLLKRLDVPGKNSASEPTALAIAGSQLLATVLAPQPSDDDAVLQVLNAKTGQASSPITTGARANFVLADASRQQMYVANFETNTVSVFGFDGIRRSILTVGPGPQGMQLTPDGRTLVVANYYGNSMSIVELDSGIVSTFPLALDGKHFANPSHLIISPDGQYALVAASGTNGHLLKINLASQTIENALPLGPLPFDIAAAPAANES